MSEVKFLMILPIISSIIWGIYIPVSYDEAWTYLNFTSKGLLTSISYYPAPNNHILHSAITNLTINIPFLNTLQCIRIPAVFTNFIIWIIAYHLINKHFNRKISLIVVSVSSMLFMSIYYSYMSRGYALYCLFFIISFYYSLNIVKGNTQKKQYASFALSSILGFYTMPSFLYPFITLNIFILLFNCKQIINQILTNTIIFIFVFVLYMPIIIVNGLHSITSNKYTIPIPTTTVLQNLPDFFANAITEITGISHIYILLLLSLSLVLILLRRKNEEIKLAIIFIFSPFLLLIIHSVLPFSRTFFYYNTILTLLIIMPLSNFLEKINLKYLMISLFTIQCALLCNFNYNILKYESYNTTSNNIINEIKGNKKYLCNSGLFETLLQYELKTNGYYNAKIKYFGAIEMNTDTIPNYDYIIIDKSVDKTRTKKIKTKTNYFNIY